MKDRRDYMIAVLAAGLLFCLGLMAGSQFHMLPTVAAQDGFGPETPVGGAQPEGNTGVTISPVNPIESRLTSRTIAPTPTNSDSNNRFIAVTSPIGSGETVLFLIDSENEQVACYRFDRNKGLRFLAGRKVTFDLKVTGYQDVSELSYDQMRELYTKQVAKAAAKALKTNK